MTRSINTTLQACSGVVKLSFWGLNYVAGPSKHVESVNWEDNIQKISL